MKKILITTLLAGALILVACGPAPSNEFDDTMGNEIPGGADILSTGSPMAETTGSPDAMSTGEATEAMEDQEVPSTGENDPGRVTILLDIEVQAADGSSLGTVDELILDVQAGTVEYVVVANANGELVPVPFDQLTWDETAHAFVYSGDVAAFEGAPSFREYPNSQQPDWDAEFQSYWSAY